MISNDHRARYGFVAKAVLGVPTTGALVERLSPDKSPRRAGGWERRAGSLGPARVQPWFKMLRRFWIAVAQMPRFGCAIWADLAL
jgi:hypothetical protein